MRTVRQVRTALHNSHRRAQLHYVRHLSELGASCRAGLCETHQEFFVGCFMVEAERRPTAHTRKGEPAICDLPSLPVHGAHTEGRNVLREVWLPRQRSNRPADEKQTSNGDHGMPVGTATLEGGQMSKPTETV